ELTGESRAGRAATKLAGQGRAFVIVTCGEGGVWCAARDEAARHFPAFAIEAVDTTGCGDVFHGAYAAALAKGVKLEERIRFASAAAALKATRHGGQEGIPTRTVVEKFLRRAARLS